MSGFEVAGVVLGTLPLVIAGLEAYIGFMKDWGKAASELKSIHRQLTTERAKLHNICEQLLSDVVPPKDIEPMLQDPFGPLWQATEIKRRVHRRLHNSYEPFRATVIEIQEALHSVQEKLKVQVSHDGQVKWVERRWMPREFRKLLYRLDRRDYQETLTVISSNVTDLESLTRLSLALEPTRRKRSGGRVTGLLRDISSSLHRALQASFICGDSHDVSLGISTPITDRYEEDEDKILNQKLFRVAISFEMDEKYWDQFEIQRQPLAQLTNEPPRPSSPTVETPRMRLKRHKTVAFVKEYARTTFVSARSDKLSKDTPLAVESVTQHLQLTCLHTEPTSLVPLNICRALKEAHSTRTRPDCGGHLVDSTSTTHCFKMYPLATTNSNSCRWSIITLQDVMDAQHQDSNPEPLLWLEDKVRLALAVASAVLQLTKTPWLPESLTKKDVHFFRRGTEWQGYQEPFLRGQIRHIDTEPATTGVVDLTVARRHTLFRLGVLLLEIILGSALETMQDPNERGAQIEIPGDKSGIIRDSIAVHRLLQTQGPLIHPAYRAVIERCVAGGSQGRADDDEWVYNGVVAELEALLECTKISY